MKYLVSYLCEHRGQVSYGYAIENSPEEFIENTQGSDYPEETYILLNALPITDELAERWDGTLKGM